MPPPRYSVVPDPRSRFFNPTSLDDPELPIPAPALYAYEIPELSDDFAAPVICEDQPKAEPQRLHPAVAAEESKVKILTIEQAESTPPQDATLSPKEELQEIQLVDFQVEDLSNPEVEEIPDSATPSTQLRVVPIPKSVWESLPQTCLLRMFEFDSIVDEYEQTYDSEPAQNQRDSSKRLTLREIVKLAQINSRDYQTQKESLYIAALRLTLERFDYQFKFTPDNNGTDVTYFHTATGGTSVERLLVPSQFMMNKILATGGDFLARFANDVILTFNGPEGFAADVSSELLFSVTQPILQRDIVFEDLTQAERNVVYAARDFARFRKRLFRDLASQYYNLLLAYRQIEIAAQNYFSNVRGFEQGMAEYRAGRLPRFQVDQFEQDALSARNTLIVRCNDLERALDQLKLIIGLPTETPLNLNLQELEELTLRDEAQVAQEQVRRARRNLLSELEQATPDQSVLLNGAIDLTRRMLRVMELREAIGEETPEQQSLGQLLAQLLVTEARLLVQFNRTTLQEEREATPPAPPVRIFQRTLELTDSIRILAQRQIELAQVLNIEPAKIQQVQAVAEQIDRRLADVGAKLAQIVRDRQLDEVANLVQQAEQLLVDAEQLETQALALLPADAVRGARDLADTINTVDQLLKRSEELSSEQGQALSPVQIDMDDAMMTALLLRFDLMNQRGFLADAWRQIKLAADDLKSVLDLNASHSLRTEKNRPFGFTLDESETRLNLSFDTPLNRRAQRNDFRLALIGFQASQRDLIELEDNIKFAVRNDLRQLQLDQEQYVIAVASAALAFERVVSTRLQLQLGIEDVAARDVLEAQRAFAASLSSVASAHITYILDRTDLFLDLEELWVDADGFWPDLYNVEVQPTPQHEFPKHALPIYGELPDRVWYSKKMKRMLKVPPGHPVKFETQAGTEPHPLPQDAPAPSEEPEN